jgi:hypothetical protein
LYFILVFTDPNHLFLAFGGSVIMPERVYFWLTSVTLALRDDEGRKKIFCSCNPRQKNGAAKIVDGVRVWFGARMRAWMCNFF